MKTPAYITEMMTRAMQGKEVNTSESAQINS